LTAAKVRAIQQGERVMLAVEVPDMALTSPAAQADGTVQAGISAVTMDAERWRDIARQITRAADAADRDSDPDHLAARVRSTLDQVVAVGLSLQIDPVMARRRAVAGLLHRIGDMVGTGTIREFDVTWSSPVAIRVTVQTPTRTVVARYDLAKAGA
jgi:hypothetical protein